MRQTSPALMTVNTGSSSLKLALYALRDGEQPLLSGAATRIGLERARLRIAAPDGSAELDEHEAADHETVLARFVQWTGANRPTVQIAAVGHRIVHGGADLCAPTRVTPDVIDSLASLVPLAPDHLPQALSAIDAVGRALPGVEQVACFDTAFHRTLPRVAQLLPLPRALAEEGVIRYGFHGLSYEYVVGELGRIDPVAAAGRLIVAHLGNGASMAAIREGRSVDTTMGFTPAGGIVMGTRPGDLDPGVLVYLVARRGLDGASLNELVNRRAGLLGVSDLSPDAEDLLESPDGRAAEALELFCYQARKAVGALTTVLGGLDTLVFTAGIGEHSAAIRWRICENLEYLGIQLDRQANERAAPVISAAASAVTVRVLATDEDLVIARHTRAVLERSAT